MSKPSLSSVHSLQLPLALAQQLAGLSYQQGLVGSTDRYSPDLLAAMQSRSEQAAAALNNDDRHGFSYARALQQLHPATGKALDCAAVCSLHRQLNLDGGQLRRVKRKVDGPGAPPQQTATTIKAIEPALEQLLLTLDQALTDGLEPLLVIPLFSLDFMRIFPFLDGNRRICLLLTRHLLIRHGHPIFAYVDLESEVAVAGNAFYQALDGCQSEQAPHPWLAFWWLVLMRTYQRFNQQVMEAAISPGRGGKTALVEGFIAQQQGPFLFADISAALPTISTDLIRVVLRKLRDQGRVKASGRGRGTTWSATQQQTIEPTTGQLHALL